MSSLKFLACMLPCGFKLEEKYRYVERNFFSCEDMGNCQTSYYTIDEFLEFATQLKEIAEQLKAEMAE